MATSQNPDFISTKNDLIRDTYALLNIYGADESVNASDYELAGRFLNRMIKTWMSQGYHLWLKETAYLFPQKSQSLYRISSTSTDHATLTYYETKLSDDASTGDNFIIVDDISNMVTSDYLGIILDNNQIFWTTIDSILGSQVDFPASVTLPSDASAGRKVFNYRVKLDSPLNIYSMVRNIDGIDVPMNYLSYEEYFQLPNKFDTTSTPVSYNYDKQLNEAIIRLWQPPDTANLIIKFTMSRKIYNFDVNSDEPDFPMEWHQAIVYNLAVIIAPSFGKNKDAGYQLLVQQANAYLREAATFDNELGSVYFKPDFRR